ncbi:WD repeat-containing protein 4 [Gonapodya sp. JEL0774]|nr:WD repeat-containing protein 4 [Gonapodya sp. JEL0774]
MYYRIVHHKSRDLLVLVHGGRFAVVAPSTNDIILAPSTCVEASSKAGVTIKFPVDDGRFHKQPIRSVAWSPVQPLLVTIGEEKRQLAVSPPKLLLGHVSMLTDLAISPDDRFIITADRDEHVRVTHYPRTHVIRNWCLGHTQFVSQLSIFPTFPAYLLSAGGDGTLLVWEWVEARLVQTVKLEEAIATAPTNPTSAPPNPPTVSCLRTSPDGRHVALIVEDFPYLLVYDVTRSEVSNQPMLSSPRAFTLGAQPLDATYFPDGTLLVSLVDSPSLEVVTLTEGKAVSAAVPTRKLCVTQNSLDEIKQHKDDSFSLTASLGSLGWTASYDLFPTGKWRKDAEGRHADGGDGEGDEGDDGDGQEDDEESESNKEKSRKIKKARRS